MILRQYLLGETGPVRIASFLDPNLTPPENEAELLPIP
jgi:hypothetical protein